MPSPHDKPKPLPRVVVIDGRRALYCPVCSVDGGRFVVLKRYEVEFRTPSDDETSSREFVATPQARYTCMFCGYGEVYLRAPKEHREADEERRRAESA